MLNPIRLFPFSCFRGYLSPVRLHHTFADWSGENVPRSNSFLLPLSDPCRDTTIGLFNDYQRLRGIEEQRVLRFDAQFAIVVRLFLTVDAQRRPWQRVQT